MCKTRMNISLSLYICVYIYIYTHNLYTILGDSWLPRFSYSFFFPEECLSGIFYESDHDGNRAMCSYAPGGCAANVSTTCRAAQPICHGADAKPTKPTKPGGGQSSSVVPWWKLMG